MLAQEPQRAGKITGMLLELTNEAVLHLLATPAELSKDVSPRHTIYVLPVITVA